MEPTVGIPCRLLRDFVNRKITVETCTGDVFKGVVVDVGDNMSMNLSAVKATFVDGSEKEISSLFIKGTRIRLISLPDSAKDSLASLNRPSFRRGGGRGGRGGGFRGGRGGFGRGGGKPDYHRSRY